MVELSHRWMSAASRDEVRPSLDSVASRNEAQPSLDALYSAHADFVWRCLQRLGVPAIDLEDALQEVFVVAHHRLRDFDPDRALVTTWLFGICSNVGRDFRRRVRRRTRAAEVEPRAGLQLTPEDELHRARMRVRLLTLLDGLSPALRATLVMFEIEGKSCAEISELTGAPLGTVHSRLHKARKRFRVLLDRQRRQDALVLRNKP